METLSIRAQKLGAGASNLLNTFMLVQKNSYDEKLNPNGICNCGVAENYLCENELISKLQSIQIWKRDYMYYPDPLGQITLRKTLCDFFKKIFQLNSQLDPNRMLISSGLSGIMSILSYLLGDHDDIFLIPSPYYTAFDHDISAFSNCTMFQCPLLEQNTGKFRFSVEIFERGYDEAISKGLRPRGIIIVNPSNPLGDVYDEETIAPILKFAAEKELHVIIDEIYSLSLFENENSFQSMLNYTSIIDQKRTHFVWSVSKDFALSGLRIGVLYSGSNELCLPGGALNFIQAPSIIVQEIMGKLLSDDQWVNSYIKLNRSRLTKQYEKVKKKIEDIDNRLYVRPSKAGFFIWTDFRLLLHKITFEEENRLYQLMLSHGVYISSGYNLGCSEPGWFRMIFSVRENWIDEAIKRLKLALDTYYQQLTISSTE